MMTKAALPPSRKLTSYCGVVPAVCQSADTQHHAAITKEGRAAGRGVWVQAAHAMLRSKQKGTEPLWHWYERIRKRRGKQCAIIALTRKRLVMAYHLLNEKTVYEPELLAA